MSEILLNQLKLGEKIGSITARDHWEQVEKSTGFKNELLFEEDVPECIIHIWFIFWELSRQRESFGGMGGEIKPITSLDILSHSNLMKLYLQPSEVKVLIELDKVYLKHTRDGLSKSTN